MSKAPKEHQLSLKERPVTAYYKEAMTSRNRMLEAIGALDLGTRTIVEMLEAIFHIEDLYELAKGNSFIAMNFVQLVTNIDYCLLVGMVHDKNQPIQPAGETNLGAELGSVIVGSGAQFPNTIEGVILAISHCFKIQAAKMDTLIDVNVVSAFMQGSGAAQIAQDTIKSFSNAGMQILKSAEKVVPSVVGL